MPIGDLLASITGGSSSPANVTVAVKRKANDDLKRPKDKAQRTTPPSTSTSGPAKKASKPTVDTSLPKPKTSSNGRPPIHSAATSSFKHGQPTPPLNNGPSKPPKKGSYAEIMARAKAAQGIATQVGKIQHKAVEKLPSKAERAERRAHRLQRPEKGLGDKRKLASGQRSSGDGPNGVREKSGKVRHCARPETTDPEKKIKKAALATTGYSGTARPRPGSGKSSQKSTAKGPLRNDREGRFRDDEDDSYEKRYQWASGDEEDDNEDDYGSDVSSDMEAAAFEVDDEEEEAARIARREDAEALAEENRLKREKEEKKRRLMAMAKARPGQKY